MKTKLKNYFLSAIFSIPLAFGFMVQGAVAEKVMRVIPHADLKNLDPIWTTAYISRNHGYMVYDCLLYTSPSPRDWMVSRMPSSA